MTMTMTPRLSRDTHLDKLLSTPQGKRLAKDFYDEQLTKRRAAAAAISQHKAELAAATPGLWAERERTQEHAKSLAKALAEANHNAMLARNASMSADSVCQAKCRPHFDVLRATADESIGELLEQVSADYSSIGKLSASAETKHRAELLAKNGLAVIEELRNAVPFEVLTRDELTERLAELRKRVGLTEEQ